MILLPTNWSDQSRLAPDSKLNFWSVIGILSHPGDGASGRLSNATNASYIAAFLMLSLWNRPVESHK
ncbi:hypothetical protein LguiA_011620 [Lonicera macranthoides]